jgi:alpha-mannosidase
VIAQKWSAVVSEQDDLALTIVNNGTYASSFKKRQMRITLLRCPAYVAHPVKDWAIVPDNMFRPRIDQGERLFNFWMNAGTVEERMCAVAREAQIHNEKPMAQWFSPSGCGIRPKPFAVLSNRNVQITAIKQAENGKDWIIRLFEPTGRSQKTQLRILVGKSIRKTVTLQPFEIKTLKIDAAFRSVVETNLMEETK